ncbi:hypothetical protein Tco_1555010 [Tanacetum coccineum]|uniref:Uncharacterized protein n=1 Tax=Tanacetum coccineum TaxID=301880 RepID=A0ABQ5B8J0_9ASTR
MRIQDGVAVLEFNLGRFINGRLRFNGLGFTEDVCSLNIVCGVNICQHDNSEIICDQSRARWTSIGTVYFVIWSVCGGPEWLYDRVVGLNPASTRKGCVRCRSTLAAIVVESLKSSRIPEVEAVISSNKFEACQLNWHLGLPVLTLGFCCFQHCIIGCEYLSKSVLPLRVSEEAVISSIEIVLIILHGDSEQRKTRRSIGLRPSDGRYPN